MCDHVTDKIIASNREKRNETTSARTKKIEILNQLSSSLSNPSDTELKIAKNSTIAISSLGP